MRRGLVRSLLSSSSLQAAMTLGVSGLALACGNLILARVLPIDEFARFALVFAVIMIGINVGPMGADVVLTRSHYDPGPKLHRQVLLTSGAVGLVLVTVCALLYPLSPALLALIMLAVTVGGVRVVAIAYYRSQQRFISALALQVSNNLSVLFAAGISLVAGKSSALLPSSMMTIALCAVAAIGWHSVAAERDPSKDHGGQPYPWRDSWSAAAFAAASMIMTSLERVATPRLLDLSALATFTVLATVAGSAFTILYQGVSFTLVPRLRSAASLAERRRVFKHESAIIGLTCLVAGLASWWLTPLVVTYILANRYQIGTPLLLVTIGSGILKVLGTLPASALNALGTPADLVKLGVVGWLTIAVSLVGAAIGARWGLIGVISGITVGWLARAVTIGWLALPLFSETTATAMPLRRQDQPAR